MKAWSETCGVPRNEVKIRNGRRWLDSKVVVRKGVERELESVEEYITRGCTVVYEDMNRVGEWKRGEFLLF